MCEDKYPFMIGGVGSGKTTAFCIFALNQCAKREREWEDTIKTMADEISTEGQCSNAYMAG